MEANRPLTQNTRTKRGRKTKYGKREMLNAIFYLLRTGCSWRHLPHDFPPWKTVYTQLRTWKLEGFFEKANHYLRGQLRKLLNREEEPSAGIVLFWNETDLQRKIDQFQHYFNENRTHMGLKGQTPNQIGDSKRTNKIDLKKYNWKSHCNGLFQLPSAA